MAINWQNFNWKEGFNRLWLFLSALSSIIVFIIIIIDISSSSYSTAEEYFLAAAICFGLFLILFVAGHIMFRIAFRIVLAVIRGYHCSQWIDKSIAHAQNTENRYIATCRPSVGGCFLTQSQGRISNERTPKYRR